jgi:quinol monooxygenase YgiN
MGFVQIIEIKTSRIDDLEALHEQWLADTEGVRTVASERICHDRDNPDTYLLIVEFPSHEAAMANNDLPATKRIAEGIASLADEPPIFRNLDLVRSD